MTSRRRHNSIIEKLTHQLNERGWKCSKTVGYGDSPISKTEDTTSLVFMNIGGLLASNLHQKNSKISSLVRAHDIHILGLAETNLNWR